MKTYISIIIGIFISNSVFSQDTSSNQQLSENQTYQVTPENNNNDAQTQSRIYRDTRLGSSAPQNSTYQTNNNGAGSITTNPNKGSGSTLSPNFRIDSNQNNHVYRDTRLGSSSPLYDTYEKNAYGAGAITTNPHKSGGGVFTAPTPMYQTPADTSVNVNVYDSLGNVITTNPADSISK